MASTQIDMRKRKRCGKPISIHFEHVIHKCNTPHTHSCIVQTVFLFGKIQHKVITLITQRITRIRKFSKLNKKKRKQNGKIQHTHRIDCMCICAQCILQYSFISATFSSITSRYIANNCYRYQSFLLLSGFYRWFTTFAHTYF